MHRTLLVASLTCTACFDPSHSSAGLETGATTQAGVGESSTGAPAEDDSGAVAGAGRIAFVLDGSSYLVDASAGATPVDLAPGLAALGSGVDDPLIRLSRDGAWLLMSSERFAAECVGYPCLSIVASDLSSGAALTGPDGVTMHGSEGAAISSDGGRVVFTAGDGPNARDLFFTAREDDRWSTPLLLTGDSTYMFNTTPSFAPDDGRVAFDCGAEPYGAEGTAICEVAIDGSGFVVRWSPDQPPTGQTAGGALHSPAYTADGGLVFEGSWTAEQLWVLGPADAEPTRLRADETNDNSPCVLPDGRIASLWLGRAGNPGGLHELVIKSSDGASSTMIVEGRDVADVGLGCGG